MRKSFDLPPDVSVLADGEKVTIYGPPTRSSKMFSRKYGRNDRTNGDKSKYDLARNIRVENYKEDGEDKVKYYIAGEIYTSFEDMIDRGLSEEDVKAIQKELWRKHEQRKILHGIVYPTEATHALRKLEKDINAYMDLFGLATSGILRTWPCFFDTERCQTYSNGTVIWQNRRGESKISKRTGRWKHSWSKSKWCDPYFRCLSCLEEVTLRDSAPVILRYINQK